MLKVTNLSGFGMAPSAAAGPVVIVSTDDAGLNATQSTFNLSVDCGSGGDIVVGVVSLAIPSAVTVLTWTLGGQTVTSFASINSVESSAYMGIATGVGVGTQTMSVTWSANALRTMTRIWEITGADTSAAHDTATSTANGWTANIDMLANGAGFGFAITNSGSAFTGSTGFDFDGNTAAGGNAGGSSKEFATAQSSLAVGFTGTDSQNAAAYLSLGPG